MCVLHFCFDNLVADLSLVTGEIEKLEFKDFFLRPGVGGDGIRCLCNFRHPQ